MSKSITISNEVAEKQLIEISKKLRVSKEEIVRIAIERLWLQTMK